jgi:hypothetical protein
MRLYVSSLAIANSISPAFGGEGMMKGCFLLGGSRQTWLGLLLLSVFGLLLLFFRWERWQWLGIQVDR